MVDEKKHLCDKNQRKFSEKLISRKDQHPVSCNKGVKACFLKFQKFIELLISFNFVVLV